MSAPERWRETRIQQPEHRPSAPLSRNASKRPESPPDHRRPAPSQRWSSRAAARAERLAPVGLDPDAALVGEAEQHRVGMEVFGRQPGNGVVAGFRLGIENPGRTQSSQPRSFLLSICSDAVPIAVCRISTPGPDVCRLSLCCFRCRRSPHLRIFPDPGGESARLAPNQLNRRQRRSKQTPGRPLLQSCHLLYRFKWARVISSGPWMSRRTGHGRVVRDLTVAVSRLSCFRPQKRELVGIVLDLLIDADPGGVAARSRCSAAGSAGRWLKPPAAAPSSCAHAAGRRACRCRR